MGWLIAAGVLGLFGLGVTIAQNETSLSMQEEQIRNESNNASITSLENSITSITNTLGDIQSLDATNDTYQSEIANSNEWLENYRRMLAGDRTDTSLGRELFGYEQQKEQAERNATTYLASSAVEKQNAYDTALESYTQMLKQKSLLNVAASGSGQTEGAYSAAQLIQNQSIRKFVGNDMVFNSDGEGTSLADGSFLMSYSALQKEITATIADNNLKIEVAQNTIKDFYENYETMSNEKQTLIDDRTKAIELNKETIETYKQTIKNNQTNALTALKTAMETRSGEDAKKLIDSYAERLDAANKSVESYTGDSSGYSAADTISEMEAEEKRKAEESAGASSESSSYSSRDREENTRTISNAERTAQRDQEKGIARTEQIKQQEKEVQKGLSTNSGREEKFNTKKKNRVTK